MLKSQKIRCATWPVLADSSYSFLVVFSPLELNTVQTTAACHKRTKQPKGISLRQSGQLLDWELRLVRQIIVPRESQNVSIGKQAEWVQE